MSGFVKEGREVVDKISKKRKENVQKIRKKKCVLCGMMKRRKKNLNW